MKFSYLTTALFTVAALSLGAANAKNPPKKAAIPVQVENAAVKGTDGSTFGLGARPIKIKGSAKELENARRKYESGRHGPEYFQKTAAEKRAKKTVRRWERRPSYDRKKDAKLIAFAQKVVSLAKNASDRRAFKNAVSAMEVNGDEVLRYNCYRAASHYLFYEVKDYPEKINWWTK